MRIYRFTSDNWVISPRKQVRLSPEAFGIFRNLRSINITQCEIFCNRVRCRFLSPRLLREFHLGQRGQGQISAAPVALAWLHVWNFAGKLTVADASIPDNVGKLLLSYLSTAKFANNLVQEKFLVSLLVLGESSWCVN